MKKMTLAAVVCLVLALLLVPVAKSGDSAYLGHKKCKMCHMKQYKSWAKTVHAKALDTLKEGNKLDGKDHTTDAECLPCHVTGYGADSGFKNETDTPTLAGVTCESCHGAGADFLVLKKKNKAYSKAERDAAGVVAPGEKQCITCHNKKSPTYKEFKFTKEENVHVSVPLKREHK